MLLWSFVCEGRTEETRKNAKESSEIEQKEDKQGGQKEKNEKNKKGRGKLEKKTWRRASSQRSRQVRQENQMEK